MNSKPVLQNKWKLYEILNSKSFLQNSYILVYIKFLYCKIFVIFYIIIYIYKRFTLLKIFLWCRGPKQLFYALISTKWNVKFVFKNKNFACDCLNYAKIQNIKEKKKICSVLKPLTTIFAWIKIDLLKKHAEK